MTVQNPVSVPLVRPSVRVLSLRMLSPSRITAEHRIRRQQRRFAVGGGFESGSSGGEHNSVRQGFKGMLGFVTNPRWRGKFQSELRSPPHFAVDSNPAAVGFDDLAG